MNLIKKTGLITAIIVVSGISIFAISFENKNKITHEGTANYYPTSADFAGEKTPLNIPDVN